MYTRVHTHTRDNNADIVIRPSIKAEGILVVELLHNREVINGWGRSFNLRELFLNVKLPTQLDWKAHFL